MSDGEWKELHFSITGEFITEHSRNLMIEGEWAQALKLLTECLYQDTPEGHIGITLEQAIDILSGRRKLVGTDQCDLVRDDDDHTAYLHQLAYMYGSIVRLRGRAGRRWYAPYAYVSSYGWDDVSADYGISIGDVPRVSRYGKSWSRASYYMDDRVNDICFHLSKTERTAWSDKFDYAGAFLFKQCDAPPFWFPINENPLKSLQACIDNRNWLERRGAVEEQTEDPITAYEKKKRIQEIRDGEDPSDLPGAPSQDVTNSVKSDLLKSMGATTGLDPRALGSMIGAMMGETDTESKPEPDPSFEHESGYVLQDGTFYGCDYYQHAALAKRILMHVYGFTEEQAGDAEKEADKRGFLRIQKSADGVSVTFLLVSVTLLLYDGKRATQPQLDTVQGYCERHGTPYPEHLLSED
jgi:hypothetical protein